MTHQRDNTAPNSASVVEHLETARAAGTILSHSERVLLTASEFWVAVANRSLIRHLRSVPRVVLRDAEAAFAAIEIPGVADILRDARIAAPAAKPSALDANAIADLQGALGRLVEPVDDNIGRIAVEQTWSRLKRPTFLAAHFEDSMKS